MGIFFGKGEFMIAMASGGAIPKFEPYLAATEQLQITISNRLMIQALFPDRNGEE